MDLAPIEVSNFFKYFWLTLWAYNAALTCTKFSLLFQYKRIFVTPRFQIAVKVMLVLLTLYGLWTLFGCIFICWPISYFWTREGNGKCIPAWPLFIGNTGTSGHLSSTFLPRRRAAAPPVPPPEPLPSDPLIDNILTTIVLNILTDFMIILSPLPVLTALQLPRRQKVALLAVFLVGGFVVIVSFIRLAQFIKSNGATDFSWENVSLGAWSITECCIGIVCSSVPALKPLVIRFFPKFGSTNSGTRSQTGGQSRNRTGADTERGNVTFIGAGDDEKDGLDDLRAPSQQVQFSKGPADGIAVVTTTTVSAKVQSVTSDMS